MHIIFFLLALFSITKSLICTEKGQCSAVSTNPNYADCVSGLCECSTLGFIGNASVLNKCRCVLPNKVYWDNGLAYCINYDIVVQNDKDNLKEDTQLSIVNTVLKSLIWPTPTTIIYALMTHTPNPIFDLFELDAKGRVDPLGTFSGRDGLVEYFYGPVWTGSTRITKVTFKKLISQDNIVYMNAVYLFENWDQTLQNKLSEYNLTQSGSFTFSENGKIKSTDLIIHNAGAMTTASNPISDPKSEAFIMQTCGIILGAANCTADKDPEGYYTGYPDCIHHFTNVYRGGSFDNLYFDGNTSFCRFFHSLLAIVNPIHCSHSGVTGGHKCVDHPYESYYYQNY